MLTIGAFTENANKAIDGKLCGLGIGTIPVLFEDNPAKKDNQPDYYLMADPYTENCYPIGKAWKPKKGKEHYYVKIESPFLHMPVIKASLFPDKQNQGQFNLIWFSPDDNAPKAGAKAEAEAEPEPATPAPVQAKQPQKQRTITSMIGRQLSPKP